MKYHHLIHSNLPEIKEIPVQMYRAVHGFSKDKVNYSTYTDKRTESFNYAIGTLFFKGGNFFLHENAIYTQYSPPPRFFLLKKVLGEKSNPRRVLSFLIWKHNSFHKSRNALRMY